MLLSNSFKWVAQLSNPDFNVVTEVGLIKNSFHFLMFRCATEWNVIKCL